MAYNPGVTSIGGQLIGQGLASLGQNLGKGISAFQANKAEFQKLKPLVEANMSTLQQLAENVGESVPGLPNFQDPKDIKAHVETMSLPELQGFHQMFMSKANSLLTERKMQQDEDRFNKQFELDKQQFEQTQQLKQDQFEQDKQQFEQTQQLRQDQFEQGKEEFKQTQQLREATLEFDKQMARQTAEAAANINEFSSLSESARQAYTYADRMAQDSGLINGLIEKGFDPKKNWTPEMFKSEGFKMYEMAKRDWIAAKLRRESGAAISDEEYKKDDKIYFPQVNDPPAVRELKRKIRMDIENAQFRSTGLNEWERYRNEAFDRGRLSTNMSGDDQMGPLLGNENIQTEPVNSQAPQIQQLGNDAQQDELVQSLEDQMQSLDLIQNPGKYSPPELLDPNTALSNSQMQQMQMQSTPGELGPNVPYGYQQIMQDKKSIENDPVLKSFIQGFYNKK